MKICSLLPSGTEILFALGLGDQIIGVTDLCDYPPEAQQKRIVCRSKIDASALSSAEVEALVRQFQETGESPFELDQEWLLSQSPDVVLTQDLCFYCDIDASVVKDAVQVMPQAPHTVVLQPRTLEEVFDSIHQVGEACHAKRQSADLVAGLRKRVQHIQDKLARVNRRPRVFSLEGINPLVVGGHWIPDLLIRAGGQLEQHEPGCAATRIKWQEVVEHAPEKLYVDLCSSDLERNLREIPWLATQQGWNNIPAVKSGEVYLLDHAYFSRPGPRIIVGLEILAQLTHPDIFSGFIPPGSVAKLDPELASARNSTDIADWFRPYS